MEPKQEPRAQCPVCLEWHHGPFPICDDCDNEGFYLDSKTKLIRSTNHKEDERLQEEQSHDLPAD